MGKNKTLVSMVDASEESRDAVISYAKNYNPRTIILFFSTSGYKRWGDQLAKEISSINLETVTLPDEYDVQDMFEKVKGTLIDRDFDEEYHFHLSSGTNLMAAALAMASALFNNNTFLTYRDESADMGNDLARHSEGTYRTVVSPVAPFDMLMEWVLKMVEDHDYKAATEFLGALERFHEEEERFSDVYAATWLFRHWSESDYSNALFVLRENEIAPIRGMVEKYDNFLRAAIRNLDDEHGNKNALIIDKYQNARRCYAGRRYEECLQKLEQAIELIVEGGINSLGFSHGRIDPDDGMFNAQERNHLKEWEEKNRIFVKDGSAIDVHNGILALSWKDEKFKEVDRLRKRFDSARREILFRTVPKKNIGYCAEICLKAVRDMIGIVIEPRESKRLMDSSEFVFKHKGRQDTALGG